MAVVSRYVAPAQVFEVVVSFDPMRLRAQLLDASAMADRQELLGEAVWAGAARR